MWDELKATLAGDLGDDTAPEPEDELVGEDEYTASDHWLLNTLLGPRSFGDEPDPSEPAPGDQSPARIHDLVDDPATDAEHKTIWRYTPTDARRLYADVQYVADANTFVGRILLAITRGGDSKNFEEITGQDGLTFGITDFAGNEGCTDFFQKFYENYHCP